MPNGQPATPACDTVSPCTAGDILLVFPSHDADGLASDVVARVASHGHASPLSVLCLWLEPNRLGSVPRDRVTWSYREPVAATGTTLIVAVASSRYEEVRVCLTRALSETAPTTIVVISGVSADELQAKLMADYPPEVYWKLKLHPMAGVGGATPSVKAARIPALVQRRRAAGLFQPE